MLLSTLGLVNYIYIYLQESRYIGGCVVTFYLGYCVTPPCTHDMDMHGLVFIFGLSLFSLFMDIHAVFKVSFFYV